MNKYFQQGLLTVVLVSLAACGGGSSGGKKSTPSSSAVSSSQATSSLATSSVTETSSSSAESSAAPASSSLSSTEASSSVGTSSSSSSSVAQPLTGVFVDNVVAGIGYRTPTHEGVTSPLGEYTYQEGESVVFFIGDLELPPVPAKGIVTPADIAAAVHTDEAEADVTKTNILQLLQTLDKDGDPVNGIQIPATAADQFTGGNLPDITQADFDSAVAAFLPEGSTLVSAEDANAHFESALRSQILGSWIYSEGEGKRNVLSFVEDSRYVIIHEHDDEDSQLSGSVEYGTYELDLVQNELRVQRIAESDAHGGLYDEDAAEAGVVTHTISLDGTTLTLGTPLDGQAVFSRVTSTDNPLIGGWTLYESEADNLNVLTFLSATEYVMAHTNNQESYNNTQNQPLSGEFGTYTLTGRQLQVTGASIDTDGEGGLYNRENPDDQFNETIDITPWADLLFTDNDEGTFSLKRIGSFAAHLQDYDADGALGTVTAIRDPDGFSESYIAGRSFTAEVTLANGSNAAFIFTFNESLDEGVGSGIITATEEGEEDVTVDISWSINTTGTIIATFNDDGESFTMAIAKLVGNNTDTESKILVSIESEEESTLLESTLKMNQLD